LSTRVGHYGFLTFWVYLDVFFNHYEAIMLKLRESIKFDDTLDSATVIDAVLACSELPPAVQFWLVRKINAPWQNRRDRLAERDALIADFGAQLGGSVAAQAQKIAAGLVRPHGSQRVALEQILKLNLDKTLSAPTLRRILADKA
jgi:hypothetical protein